MEDEEKQYGRKRVKKARPLLDGTSPKSSDSQDETEKEISETEKSTEKSKRRTNDSYSGRPDQLKTTNEKEQRPERRPARRSDRKSQDQYDKKKDKPYAKRGQRPSKTSGRSRVNVSVIIPAYNEEDNIKPLVEMFDEVIKREGKDWEVVLVNDGSTDKTPERCREMSGKYRWLRVVGYPNNRGLTEALNTGFEASRGSILVFYPADLQYHAQDIPKMLTKINRGADLVAGWKQGKYKKRFVSYIYNKLCRILFGLNIHDMNSVKAFKKEVAKSLSRRKDWHRYLVVTAAESGYIIDEAKVRLYPRKHGKSKFGMGRILGGVLDLFSVKFQITFLKKPLRFFGTWGIIIGGAGFILGLVALYLRFFTNYGSRTLLFPTILLVLAGLMLFAIGFLAEVLVGLKDEIESMKSK
jgi:glycosyltransferase involved in cell wall biosynthesis